MSDQKRNESTSPARCPVCRRTFDVAKSRAAPFCSDRCRTVDLARWIDERYSAPVFRDSDEPWIEDN